MSGCRSIGSVESVIRMDARSRDGSIAAPIAGHHFLLLISVSSFPGTAFPIITELRQTSAPRDERFALFSGFHDINAVAHASRQRQHTSKRTRSSVKVTIERIPDSQVRLEIAAEPTMANEAIAAYKKVAREVVIPGFRKGKAPRAMIERYFGREMVVDEANRTLMDDLIARPSNRKTCPGWRTRARGRRTRPAPVHRHRLVYPTVDPATTSVRRAGRCRAGRRCDR